MNIQMFHLYNRLVRRNLVKPLVCQCETVYVLRATEDGDPVLQCFGCNSLVQPGIAMYDQVVAVVKEHYNI